MTFLQSPEDDEAVIRAALAKADDERTYVDIISSASQYRQFALQFFIVEQRPIVSAARRLPFEVPAEILYFFLHDGRKSSIDALQTSQGPWSLINVPQKWHSVA